MDFITDRLLQLLEISPTCTERKAGTLAARSEIFRNIISIHVPALGLKKEIVCFL